MGGAPWPRSGPGQRSAVDAEQSSALVQGVLARAVGGGDLQSDNNVYCAVLAIGVGVAEGALSETVSNPLNPPGEGTGPVVFGVTCAGMDGRGGIGLYCIEFSGFDQRSAVARRHQYNA